MMVSRFSEQKIAVLLKQVDDGVSAKEVCRKASISQQAYGGPIISLKALICGSN